MPKVILNKKISEARKGKKHSKETIKKMSDNNCYYWSGKKRPKKTRDKMRKAKIGKLGKMSNAWKGGIIKNERNDPAYHQWVRKIKLRDKQTCWINDEYCNGYNIVHHIFPWRKYPKLRYELTNGITLCQAHHPKERVKEKLFKKLFSYLVNHK